MMNSTNIMHTQQAPGASQTQFSIRGGVVLDPEKRKRNRTFIDPVSEVPRLEEWFLLNTHPSHALIARYTDELNRLPYRQKVIYNKTLIYLNVNLEIFSTHSKIKCILLIFLSVSEAGTEECSVLV